MTRTPARQSSSMPSPSARNKSRRKSNCLPLTPWMLLPKRSSYAKAMPACAVSPTRDCRSARRRRARTGTPPVLPDHAPPGIHEAAVVSPPVLGAPDDEDRIASAVTFGFVIDLAAVEIDRRTGAIRIPKYVSVHDVGTQLNPKIVEGQIYGGFAHGLGAALFEELVYDERGNFLSG